jgi:hypothetical protein
MFPGGGGGDLAVLRVVGAERLEDLLVADGWVSGLQAGGL